MTSESEHNEIVTEVDVSFVDSQIAESQLSCLVRDPLFSVRLSLCIFKKLHHGIFVQTIQLLIGQNKTAPMLALITCG